MKWSDIPELGQRLVIEACDYLQVDKRHVLESTSRKENVIDVKRLLMRYLTEECCWTLVAAGSTCSLKDHTSVMNLIKGSERTMANDINMQIIYQRSMTDFKQLNIQPYSRKSKVVHQLSLKGRLIKKWPSLKDAAKNMKVNSHSISQAIHGASKTSVGYKWKYE